MAAFVHVTAIDGDRYREDTASGMADEDVDPVAQRPPSEGAVKHHVHRMCAASSKCTANDGECKVPVVETAGFPNPTSPHLSTLCVHWLIGAFDDRRLSSYRRPA